MPSVLSNHLIIGGELVPLSLDVRGARLFRDTGLEFTPLNTRCLARVKPVDLITVHDQAGEGNGKRLYRVLLKRRLSVHFQIQNDGVIYQYCDPLLVSCAHMGPGNRRSIGIEVQNAVFPPFPPGERHRLRAFLRGVVTGKERMFGRPRVRELYRGRERTVLGHFAPQQVALKELVLVLLRKCLDVPPRLPLDGEGGVTGDRLPADWQGVASHLNFTDSHVDPASDIYFQLLPLLAGAS